MRWSREVSRGALILLASVLATCADPPSAPRLGPGSIPTATSRAGAMTIADLADDAVDRGELAALLDEAGFAAGTERSGADRAAGIHRAVVRALTFGSEDGADAYLGWLEGHVGEVIGDASPAGTIDVPTADRTIAIFHHDPGDCCPKATPAYLTAWRDGATVVTVELAGPSVGPADVEDAAGDVHLQTPA